LENRFRRLEVENRSLDSNPDQDRIVTSSDVVFPNHRNPEAQNQATVSDQVRER